MAYMTRMLSAVLATAMTTLPAWADDDKIVVGFATGASGFMEAYDKPAQDAAMIRIDEINAAGGLLGKRSRSSVPIRNPTGQKVPKPVCRSSTRAPTSSSCRATTTSVHRLHWRRKMRDLSRSSSARNR